MKMDFVSSNITSWGRADIIRLNMIPLCYYKFVELFNCNDITQFIYNFLTIEHARLVHITIFCSKKHCYTWPSSYIQCFKGWQCH